MNDRICLPSSAPADISVPSSCIVMVLTPNLGRDSLCEITNAHASDASGAHSSTTSMPPSLVTLTSLSYQDVHRHRGIRACTCVECEWTRFSPELVGFNNTTQQSADMIRGERIELDLGSDSENDASNLSAPLPGAFVNDVLERKPKAPKPPSAPVVKTKTGFPEHKKRPIVSRFKQQKSESLQHDLNWGSSRSAPSTQAPVKPSTVPSHDHASGHAKTWEEEEKERIDQENRQKLASMSAEEIEEERRELMNSLSPAFLQRLFAKSDVGSGSNEVDLSSHVPAQEPAIADATQPKPKTNKSVKFEEQPKLGDPDEDEEERLATATKDDSEAPAVDELPHDTVHFPRAPQPPELDPSSDSFLEDLHQKYFPSLPSDPDKLEWMQTSKSKNTYDPSSSALNASDIRFSFKGEIIPPSKASVLPVTLGLHHHGDAPDAAGYTVAELAHLSRSSYPAQRCIAFQTLGRVLYRLSKGEFGDPGEPEQLLNEGVVEGPEDTFGELARGLWREVERLQVIQTLVDESEGKGVDGGKHVSAKAYATEAVWLWRKGAVKKGHHTSHISAAGYTADTA
ncbi:uncharacterized protein MYCFIDRAFT_209203 [Pseudocercospora fijiensis CIRAD86]|uniref:RNA polymerase II-associated protein 1 C-terminal domain-containing protein n=1 Tax=Pseudocercospora fijiensis (strain CIRAD86) TaxID=383855 RepID=M2ZFF8_PSEFD|nr:uncharacterized protein MYCFIDRAFT_209203 [Pseudocercospora fijiensis CIRAD86]EME77864.1 hypothetical protein MYCFIDRAFT_209203 [Pseudocercospora fijiensis CIRAD86]